jgi:hypothetical protein
MYQQSKIAATTGQKLTVLDSCGKLFKIHHLLTDLDEMSILHRGSSIDASYQVLVHLALRFQRRRLKCEKLTDEMTDAK